jgi:hypothetical protein
MTREPTKAEKQEEPEGDAEAKPVEPVEAKPPPANQAQVIKNLLTEVEKQIASGAGKATLGDYIRLVQLDKELNEDEPKEIRVTWVEPETKE